MSNSFWSLSRDKTPARITLALYIQSQALVSGIDLSDEDAVHYASALYPSLESELSVINDHSDATRREFVSIEEACEWHRIVRESVRSVVNELGKGHRG